MYIVTKISVKDLKNYLAINYQIGNTFFIVELKNHSQKVIRFL